MKKLSLFLVALTLMLVSCKPEIEKPTVETVSVTETETAFNVVGNVAADGGAEVTAKGVCWAKTQNPTIENDKIDAGAGIGEFLCEITDLEPGTTYYVRAYATNEAGTAYGEEKSFATKNMINGYEYVDLGLPSGLKWATHNVGAFDIYEIGSYFAWGELKPKNSFSMNNSLTYGLPIDDFSGNAEYDVAASWGSTWRMPTEAEMMELKNNCKIEWVMINNVLQGSLLTGPNGNELFLPAGGIHVDSSVDFIESEAAYWTSTPDTFNGDLGFATFVYFYNNNFCNRGWMSRYVGMLVRPVSE